MQIKTVASCIDIFDGNTESIGFSGCMHGGEIAAMEILDEKCHVTFCRRSVGLGNKFL